MNELVSIIMPSYRCGRFIVESIRSVQAQTYQNWELIVVDDCSGDDTVELVQNLQEEDDRIKIYQNPSNCGAAVSRNTALSKAKGRWIAFLDSDDLWLPDKLEHQIKFMEDNECHFSYHEYTEIDEEGNPLGVYVSGKRRVSKFDMSACCWPGCLSVMYDSDYVGLVQIRDVKKNNDTAMWLKVIRKADCYLLKENLATYRRRKGSITPPGIKDRILWHYRLFRDAEQMNPVSASFWMCMNVLGNMYKKTFYVKKI